MALLSNQQQGSIGRNSRRVMAAIASSAMMPAPPGIRSSRLAGNGLTISAIRKSRNAPSAPTQQNRIKRQRDEHPRTSPSTTTSPGSVLQCRSANRCPAQGLPRISPRWPPPARSPKAAGSHTTTPGRRPIRTCPRREGDIADTEGHGIAGARRRVRHPVTGRRGFPRAIMEAAVVAREDGEKPEPAGLAAGSHQFAEKSRPGLAPGRELAVTADAGSHILPRSIPPAVRRRYAFCTTKR